MAIKTHYTHTPNRTAASLPPGIGTAGITGHDHQKGPNSMAQTYRCDICNEVAGDFMVTSIATGQTISVGVECLLDWAMPMVEAFQRAQQEYQSGPGGAEAVAGAAGVEWESDYPQGRSEGPETASDGTSETVGEDSETEAAAHE
jgi:hypothetical protein